MAEGRLYAAVDLGAESGRVVAGRLDDRGRMDMAEVERFPNRPVRLPDGLHWDLLGLLEGALRGLRAAAAQEPLAGVGVDAWGVDYALVDARGRLTGTPFHYRDARTAGMVERAFARVPAADLYAVTGIQTMPINTCFQLLADEGTPQLEVAARILLLPDLFSFWLCGEQANESTVASTTGLLDARSGQWATAVIEGLRLPAHLFGPLAEPGTRLGEMLPHHGLGAVSVRAVAGHDTASAFAAAPVLGAGSAILSSGTWSLLGLELPSPVLGERAGAFDLANERGVDGTIRLLKNVMGLWLVQECRRAWAAAGGPSAYEDLLLEASEIAGEVPLFDPDDPGLLAPGDMPERIAAACVALGQPAPETPGALVRSILVSLACKYRLVLEQLEAASGHDVQTVHVIGGGARNTLLCRLTADVLGRPVLAGPVEATALGNLLVQARAAGELGSLGQMRAVAAASARPQAYEPGPGRAAAEDDFGRFLTLTGHAPPARTPSLTR